MERPTRVIRATPLFDSTRPRWYKSLEDPMSDNQEHQPPQSEIPPPPPVPAQREARFPDAVILLLVFLGGQLVLGLVVGFVVAAGGRTISSLLLACIEAASLALIVPVLRKRLRHRLTDYLRDSPVAGGAWAAVVICCGGLILALTPLEAVINRLIPLTDFWRSAFSQILRPGDFAGGLVLAAIAAPAVEEILFRGIILRGFAANYGAGRGILYSSLLFGVVHMNPWQFVPAVVLGIFLGALYLRTRTVVPPLVAHALYNGSLMVLSRFAGTRAIADAEVPSAVGWSAQLAFAAAGIALLGLGFWILLRSTPSPVEEAGRTK